MVLAGLAALPSSPAEAQWNGLVGNEAASDWGEPGYPADAEYLGHERPVWQYPSYGEPHHGYPYRSPLHGRLWFRGEYLLWSTQGSWIPPLVTTSPPGTLQADAGVLGQPNTSILLGNTSLNTGLRSGGRFNLGYWLNADRQWALEASYLGLGSETAKYEDTSTGTPILARPFFDITAAAEASHLIAYPGLVQGSVRVDAATEFQVAEVLLRRALFRQYDSGADGLDRYGYRVDILAGYRYCRLGDSLRIGESLLTAGPTTIDLYDLFDTSNEFNGAELGVSTQLRRNHWSLELLMKLALGNSRSRVFIDGATTTAVGAAPPVTGDGGLLALTTNMGHYPQNGLALMPELGVTLGCDLTPRLRATFGYTFVYWSKVARPGDQISLDVNPSYLPNAGPPVGAAQPEFSLATTDFWAQGMNFGFEYRF